MAASWRRGVVSLRALQPGVDDVSLHPGESWQWDNGQGVSASLDLVPMQRASRRAESSSGDAALFTLMLMTLVCIGQVRYLTATLLPPDIDRPVHIESTPELIARLLDLNTDSEPPPPAPRMPPTSSGELTIQVAAAEPAAEPALDDREEPPTPLLAEAAPSPPVQVPEEVVSRPVPVPVPVTEVANAELAPQLRPAVLERFVTWGASDWFDVVDAQPDALAELSGRLEVARQRLRLNRDDAFGLMVLGRSAYVAENGVVSRSASRRYIELYPDDPLGYNNLALTYKREANYQEEERLYREALKLQPTHTTVLSNLAVSLAHQGQLQEALEIMERLEQLDADNSTTDLHRAKIYAVMGERDKAYRFLRRALQGADHLRVLDRVQLRQDIRLAPAFDSLRTERRFSRMVRKLDAGGSGG